MAQTTTRSASGSDLNTSRVALADVVAVDLDGQRPLGRQRELFQIVQAEYARGRADPGARTGSAPPYAACWAGAGRASPSGPGRSRTTRPGTGSPRGSRGRSTATCSARSPSTAARPSSAPGRLSVISGSDRSVPAKYCDTVERRYRYFVAVLPRARARSTRRTTSASNPSPAQNVNQRPSARPSPIVRVRPRAAPPASRRSPRSGPAAARAARANTFVDPPGTTASAGTLLRRAVREQAVDHLVHGAVAAQGHHDAERRPRPACGPDRRRDRGGGCARPRDPPRMRSARASTSRLRALVVVAFGFTTRRARMSRTLPAGTAAAP